MMGTPFRDSVVVNTWPYLGAALTSSVDNSGADTHPEEQETANGSSSDFTGGNGGAETSPRNTHVSMGAVVLTQGRANPPSANNNAQWIEAMKALLAYQVWTRSVGRMETRADLMAVAKSSVGRRCLLWNAYSDSLIPYPARVVTPDDNTVKRTLTAQRDAIQLGTPWCPLKALSALGVIHGVNGSPRCPKISVQAHGAWAYIRGAPWGPARARGEQGNLWRCAVVHAGRVIAHGSAPDVLINESINRAARVIVQTADARFIDPQAEPAHGTGSSLYAMIWHLRYAAGHREWTQERSAARRWAPGDGSEWLALTESRNMTDATRLLRLLCNALPGRARWRPSSRRAPRKCHTCGTRPVQLVWRSPSPLEVGGGEDGMAWCTDCVQPGMTENSWACLPVRMIPSSLREQAHLINQEQNRSSFDTRPSHFGPCPFCGLGEAGSEHIWQWCSAAYMAWAKCGDGSSWRDALAGRCNDRLRLTIVASQVVFL